MPRSPASSPDITGASLAVFFIFILPLSGYVAVVACFARLGWL